MVGNLVLPSRSIFQAEEDKATAKAAPAEQESNDEDCRQTCRKGCPKATEAAGGE